MTERIARKGGRDIHDKIVLRDESFLLKIPPVGPLIDPLDYSSQPYDTHEYYSDPLDFPTVSRTPSG